MSVLAIILWEIVSAFFIVLTLYGFVVLVVMQ